MQLIITNLTASELGPIVGLPDGGTIPASGEASFALQTGAQWDRVRDAIEALRDGGDLSYSIRPDATDSDAGERVYKETLRVQHSDLTAAALEEVIESAWSFPVGARLLGYYYNLDANFTGGGATSATADAGYGAGVNIEDAFSGFLDVHLAALGEGYGTGFNVDKPLPIGGGALRVKISSDVNVDTLDAGDLSVTVLYSVH